MVRYGWSVRLPPPEVGTAMSLEVVGLRRSCRLAAPAWSPGPSPNWVLKGGTGSLGCAQRVNVRETRHSLRASTALSTRTPSEP